MSTNSNDEKSKYGIGRELETVLKAAISSPYKEKNYLASEITQNICNAIEAMFIHGLRDPFFVKGSRYAKYPEPNFWPFVSKYSHSAITKEINSLNQIKSEIGRGRAWIRIVVNQNSLEHYVRLLLRESKAVNQFYSEKALLRDEEEMEKVINLLRSLDQLPIRAAVNSSFLNTWTPSPLILAGLVVGKPLKVGTLAPRYRSTSLRDAPEVGITAIDFLQSERSPLVISPIYGKERSNRKAVLSDDDDSVYSHPSMIDHSERVPERIILSSTPISSNYAERPPQNLAPLIVSRRATRPRRSSRSSSESNSKGSHSQSECTSTIAGGTAELGMSARSRSQTHLRSLGTLDSGIETENREPSTDNGRSISDDKGIVLNEVDQTNSEPSLNLPGDVSEITDGSLPDPPNEPILSIVSSDWQSSHPSNEEDLETANIPCPQDDEVFEESSILVEKSQAGGIAISAPARRDDYLPGTSLHDELILQPGSNSLLSRSWKKPKTSVSEPERCNSAQNSSSGTEPEGIVVSFDQALRSAMERSDSYEKEAELNNTRDFGFETDVEDIDDEQASDSKVTTAFASEHVTALLTTIPREAGLDAQDFRCPMCRKSIGAAFAKYGVCGIDGLYYCSDCMKAGGEIPIPSRVLRSWDWKPKPVSDRGRALIEANQDKIVIRIDQHNPTLYEHVPLLKNMKGLREKLQIASMYLFNCRESIAEDFRRRVWPRCHLYNDIHAYSITDLHQLRSGMLEKHIHGFLKHAVDHVMHCSLCRQKGFVCEICDAHDVIYPFQTETTYRCPHCFSVFHADCGSRIEDCPKCVRRAKYEVRQEASDLPLG
ncbi:hypothetical protein Q1695_012150 [Nippostrongylus brasiliensis]|nr:hypothetical protein Q1695_012150 [Nippostrongylus brasiliensis]